MKRISFFLIQLLVIVCASYAQQSTYDVTPGNGNGIRFWSENDYKIHMGSGSEYHFGPVSSYSIKSNMNNQSGRGWTWGIGGQTPIAALSNTGAFRLANEINAFGLISRGDIETEKTSYTKIELSQHDWSGSHAILFNGYTDITVNGSLATTGNTKYANDQGAYGGGAGAIMFFGNGGLMDFLISPLAGENGGDTNIDWGMPKMRIWRSGAVCIGAETAPSGYLLAVDGKAIMEEVKVEVSGNWPDYVFAEDYPLKPLEETETFIKENNRLPEMPSAAEVAENGIMLGEMNRLLVEKVEELTLHLINLQKENAQIKTELSQQLKANGQRQMANSQQQTENKLEELTLHLIRLEKENQNLKTELSQRQMANSQSQLQELSMYIQALQEKNDLQDQLIQEILKMKKD